TISDRDWSSDVCSSDLVLFEGCPEAEAGRQYPICLEGERACPPEDVGGVWGYADFLKAIANRKHKEHKEMLEWVGGRFDPEQFEDRKSVVEGYRIINRG